MRQALKCMAWALIVAGLAWQVRQPDTPLIRGLAPLLQAQQVVAKSDGVTVSQTELDLALQQHLWRRGESLESLPHAKQAEARSAAIQNLLAQKKLREARGESDGATVLASTQNEASQFTRMLGFEESRRQAALEAAQHTEQSFEQSIREALLDEHWLHQHLPVQASEKEVALWYAAHQDQLSVPAAYHAAHLFLSSHERDKPDRSAEIQQLAAGLASGADWTELVSERSEDERTRHRDGDLGWFTANRMPGDFMAAVKPLRPGQVSVPIQTTLGWHIIKLIRVKPARVPELAEVRAEIEAMLGNRQYEKAAQGTELSLSPRPGDNPFPSN